MVQSPLFSQMTNPAELGTAFAAMAVQQAGYFEAPLQCFMILRRPDVIQAFRDAETYTNRLYALGPLRQSPVSMDGARHAAVRRVYNRFFSPGPVQHYEQSIVVPAVRELVAELPKSGRFDLLPALAFKLPLNVFCRLLGMDREAGSQFMVCVNDLIRWITGTHIPEVVAAGEAADARARAIVRPLLEQEMKRPTPSLLGEIVRAVQSEGQATVEECEGAAMSLLIAGFETTNWMLAGVLSALLMNPQSLERVRAQRELIAPAVEEGMRWSNVMPFMMRMLSRPVTIGTTELPAYSLVGLCISGVHHDPELYPHPEVFDIDRRVQHCTFGHGVHYCVGAPLARMEARVLLSALLDALPRLRLDAERPARFSYGALGGPLFGPDSLNVIVD